VPCQNGMISARPLMNSERFLQCESIVYARATFAGSRVFQASSARRTFCIALSRVNGGKGGRAGVVAVPMISSPGIDSFGISINSCTRAANRVGGPCRERWPPSTTSTRAASTVIRILWLLPTVRRDYFWCVWMAASVPTLSGSPHGSARASARDK
jgi:hypothetical protein